MDINYLLKYTVDYNASDLHISSGVVPMVRIDEDLVQIDGAGILHEEEIKSMLLSVLPAKYKDILDNKLDIDLGMGVDALNARFRVNVFHQDRGMSVAIRYLPFKPPEFKDLNLPPIFAKLCEADRGLILVTGATGSGKSTTLAAMIDYLNSTKSSHILTIEDPIEYIHQCKKCLVQQREIQKHTESFSDALRAALREDPDYILVGEMRDLETIRLALTAAETGHLVFGTLHTNSAADTIDRVVDVFPANEKALIRAMFANSLNAVVAQRLLKKIGGGRVAVDEILINNIAIRNLIRDNKAEQIYSAIQTGRGEGMQTLAQHVKQLIDAGIVDSKLYGHLAGD